MQEKRDSPCFFSSLFNLRMANLPAEIFSKVFSDLDRNDKLECAVVCQAWCVTALHYLNSKLRLNTSDDVIKLFMKLCQLEGTIDGSSIRKLLFSRNWGTSLAQTHKTIFVYILSECTNLQVLGFEGGRSAMLHYDYMIRYRDVLQFESLQRIISPSGSRYSNNYLLVNWEYRQSINQLEFELARDSFEDIPVAVGLYTYVHQFPALHTLALEFHTTVWLHSLLRACPQLESLQLFFGCSVNHLKIYKERAASGQRNGTHAHFQLKCLDIDAKYVCQDLFEYLHDHTGMLTHLAINKNPTSTDPFSSAFTIPPAVDTTLPIKTIKFKHHNIMSNELIAGLNDNFYALKRIESDKCRFDRILTHDSNLTLNLNALHLEYLSIDFTNAISQNTLINSMCLVVKRHEKDTVFYQRASKWSNNHVFAKNETCRYTNENAHAKRIASASTAVITVEANTLNYIQMHCNGYRNFNQVITLN
ncbi:unnamed protein product [Mucor fragilis]